GLWYPPRPGPQRRRQPGPLARPEPNQSRLTGSVIPVPRPPVAGEVNLPCGASSAGQPARAGETGSNEAGTSTAASCWKAEKASACEKSHTPREALHGRGFGGAEVVLEPGPHIRPGPVEQHPLVGLGDVERLTLLQSDEAPHVPQRYHRPLRLGQGGDGGLDHGPGLGPEQPLLGDALPRRRWRRPGAVPEPFGVDRRFRVVAAALQGGERDAAVLPDPLGLGPIDEDPEDPGPKRRPAFEPVDSVEHAQPGLG